MMQSQRMKPDRKARRPRSIVLVVGGLGAGGAERAMVSLANRWAHRGWRVTLATLEEVAQEGIYPLHPAVRRSNSSVPFGQGTISGAVGILKRTLWLRRAIRAAQPDVVLSFLTECNVLAIAATLGLSVRTIVSERIHPGHHEVRRPYRQMRRVLYPLANAIVAQTDDVAEWITSRGLARHVHVIPNHVAIEVVKSTGRDEVLTFVGRLQQQKAVHTLLSAFSLVGNQYPQWSIDIVGDGPERVSLENRARSLGIEDRVRFRGVVRDIATIYSRSGLLVLPSKYEGFPNVLLEAMASGVAVIASDRAGAMLIRSGDNGLLYPYGEVQDLADCLRRTMGSSTLRERLGLAARKLADSHSLSVIEPLWDAVLYPMGALSELSR